MKTVLITNGEKQPNAGQFLKHALEKKLKIDRIIVLHPPQGIITYIKRFLRPIKIFLPSNLKPSIIKVIGKIYGSTMDDVRKDYNNTGMNSWDLLRCEISVKEYAMKTKTPILYSNKLSSNLFFDSDVNYIATYGGGIIHNELTENSKLVFLNAHMGEMPRYRGMNVIEWAFLEDRPTKVSVLTMNHQIDGGDVCHEKVINIQGVKTIEELRKRGYIECAKAMAEAFELIQAGKSKFIQQPKTGIRYYYRMHPEVKEMVLKKLRDNE